MCSILCMSIQSTQSNYNVDFNTKPSNYMKIPLNGSNYYIFWINSLNYNIVQIKTSNYSYFEVDNS